MKKFVLILCICLFASPTFAFTWTYHDFGTDYFDLNNNWAPIDYPILGHQPAPGPYSPGGEYYDLEGLNYHIDSDFLYLSLTNSFGYSIDGFRLGDMFIGDAQNKYKYALDLDAGGTNHGFYEVSSWNVIQQGNSYYDYIDIRNAAGAHELDQGTYLGSAMSMMTDVGDFETGYLTPGDGQTYIWEMKIDKSLINGGNLAGLSFHINVGCGNDLIETVIPEPTTMLLFGLGLLGTAAYRRRKE